MKELFAVHGRHGYRSGGGRLVIGPRPDERQTILPVTDAFRAGIETGRAARQDWLFRAIDLRNRLVDQPAG